MLTGSLLPQYEKIENLIFQRFPEQKKESDTLKKTEIAIGEARKEEESN